MRLKSLISVVSLIPFFLTFHTQASEGPSSLLLRAYGGSCPAVLTRQVQSSLGNVQGLINVVKQMRDDSECFGAQEILDIAQRYRGLYEDYEVYSHTRDSRRELEKEIQLYTSLLSDPSLSSSQQSFLETELLYAQSDLVSVESRLSRFDGLNSRYARGASELVSSIDGFFSTWASDPQCYEKGLNLWSSLISNGLLAAAAFSSPGTSLALASGAVVTNSLGQFTRNFRHNRSLERIDDIQWPTALRCVSQAMTDQFCQSKETKKLIDEYRFNRDHPGGRLEGIELLSNDLGRLDHWLQEVFAGSAITSEGDLVNREKPILQAELLQKVRRYTETYGTIREETYLRISDEQERSDAIAIGISNLVLIMEDPTLNPEPSSPYVGGSDLENPIFISRDEATLPYSLYDPSINRVPQCANNPCSNLRAYINDRGIRLDMNDWHRALRNALNVIDQTLTDVNLLRARTVSVDAFSVLVRANADHRGESNALQGLVEIIENSNRIEEYLTKIGCEQRPEDCSTEQGELVPDITHHYFPQIQNTRNTRELTQTVLDLIREGYRPRSLDPEILPSECRGGGDDQGSDVLGRILGDDEQENKSFQITSCITNILKLAERGNDVYFRKVRDMVAYELEARFLEGDFDDEIRGIIYSTRNDLVSALVDTYSSNVSQVGLSEILIGLETSMELNQRTFEEFGEVFSKAIKDLIENSDRIGSGQKGDMCFRLLPLLNEDDQDMFEAAYELCSDIEMNFYDNGPTLVWSDFVEKSSRRTILRNTRTSYSFSSDYGVEDHFCSLRNYYRDNMIIEQSMRSSHKEDGPKKMKDDKGFSFLEWLL